MSISLGQFQNEIRTLVEAARTDRARNSIHIWDHLRPPRSVRHPEEYDGTDQLAVECTQTELPAAQQRKLVERWCDVLPTLTSLRRIWFTSKVPQPLFDAACRVPQLEALNVKWSGIETLDALLGATKLRYLHLGDSGRVKNVEPLRELTQLQWLGLQSMPAMSDMSVIASLRNLDGFLYIGQGRAQVVETLAPLGELTQLKWLYLGAIRAADDSLEPLRALKRLQWLELANHFPMEEFAALAAHLAHTACERFAGYVDLGKIGLRCRKCREHGELQLTGKGRPSLCAACDQARFEKHMREFAAAAAAALG
jgi:hypothetical protein